jgi:hypothetical protein
MSKRKTDSWAGCETNEPNPRYKGSVYGGALNQVSPTDGLNPAPLADGKKVQSIKHVKSNG